MKYAKAFILPMDYDISVYDELMYRAMRRICDKNGHHWIDTSHGGPEGGDMSGYCKRCGHSFYTRLY